MSVWLYACRARPSQVCAVIRGSRVSNRRLQYVLRPFSSSTASSAGTAEEEGPGSGAVCIGVVGAMLLLPCKDTLGLEHNITEHHFFSCDGSCPKANAMQLGRLFQYFL